MAVNVLPPVRHVLPQTMIRRERRFENPATVTVRVNERVQAADIIAEIQPAPRHFYLDVARGLGISSEEVGRYLRREPDTRVSQGEILAGPVGLARRTIRAPSEGRIVVITGGKILFESMAEPVPIRAGFPGTVVASDGYSVVTLETIGTLIQGVWGNGKRDSGVLKGIGEAPDERLTTDKLDLIMRGSVLYAGTCDNSAPLHQATELSVRGLILGSMSSDLVPVARRIPYPILLTEGFGKMPLCLPIHQLLESNQGREVAVEGHRVEPYGTERPEVIIPQPASHEVDLPEDIVQFKPGVRVRVRRDPYLGAVGLVRELLPKVETMPNGVLSRCASVDLERIGATVVPLANLEILL